MFARNNMSFMKLIHNFVPAEENALGQQVMQEGSASMAEVNAKMESVWRVVATITTLPLLADIVLYHARPIRHSRPLAARAGWRPQTTAYGGNSIVCVAPNARERRGMRVEDYDLSCEDAHVI